MHYIPYIHVCVYKSALNILLQTFDLFMPYWCCHEKIMWLWFTGLYCYSHLLFSSLSQVRASWHLNNITIARVHYLICVYSCLPADQVSDPSMEEASDEGLLLKAGFLIFGHGCASEPGCGDWESSGPAPDLQHCFSVSQRRPGHFLLLCWSLSDTPLHPTPSVVQGCPW